MKIATREQLATALEDLAKEIRESDTATVDFAQTTRRMRFGIGVDPSFPCATTSLVKFEVGTKAGKLKIVEAATQQEAAR